MPRLIKHAAIKAGADSSNERGDEAINTLESGNDDSEGRVARGGIVVLLDTLHLLLLHRRRSSYVEKNSTCKQIFG